MVTGLDGAPGYPDPAADQEARAVAATCGGIRVHSLYVPNGREPDSDHYRYKLAWLAALEQVVAAGPKVEVAGLSLSREGLEGGAMLLAKGTLGVVAAIVLAATTPVRELLVGLSRLRLPAVLVAIIGFALRYLSIATDDLRRAELARLRRENAQLRVEEEILRKRRPSS